MRVVNGNTAVSDSFTFKTPWELEKASLRRKRVLLANSSILALHS